MQTNMYNLRPVKFADLKTILAWRNSEHVKEMMFSDYDISLSEHLSWYSSLAEKGDLVLIFEMCLRPVGLVHFNRISDQPNKYEWGFYLGEKSLPPKTGSKMLFWALDYLFSRYDVGKIQAEVFSFNIKSIQAHRSLGFKEIDRSFRNKLGRKEETVLFSLSCLDWRINYSQFKLKFRKG